MAAKQSQSFQSCIGTVMRSTHPLFPSNQTYWHIFWCCIYLFFFPCLLLRNPGCLWLRPQLPSIMHNLELCGEMLNNKYSGGLYRSNLATRSSCHDQLEMLCDSRTPSQAWGICTCGHCQSWDKTTPVNSVWKWVCCCLEYKRGSKASHEYFTILSLWLHVITAFTHDAWLSFSEKRWGGGGAWKAWISFALNQNKLIEWFKIPLNALITK